MKQQQPRSWLLDLTTRVLKYFLLSLAGCTLAYTVAFVLEWWLITDLIVTALEHLLLQALVLIGCLAAIAIIIESIRY